MLHDLHRSPRIFKVIETRWIRSTERVAQVGEKQGMQNFCKKTWRT